MHYGRVLAMTNNDAYNTLVVTDFAPEFGRENMYQLGRERQESKRHALTVTVHGRVFGGQGYLESTGTIVKGREVRATNVTDDFTFEA